MMFRLTSWFALLVVLVGEPHLRAEVVITEIVTSSPRMVEIQNVSENPVDTSGWLVAVNDSTNFQINDVFPTYWDLTGSIAPLGINYRHNDPAGDPEHYWEGNFLRWTQGPGWVLVMDDLGSVVDFVVWGYPDDAVQGFDVEIDGHPVTIDGIWLGSRLAAFGNSTNSLQRTGDADHDSAADWAFVEPRSMGAQNPNLTTPFIPEPSTLGLLTIGAVGLLAYGWRRRLS